MPTNPIPGKELPNILPGRDPAETRIVSKAAFVERLPFTLTYAANLEPRDRAILFYDNLVVAAEYFCAFIEEGIRRQEATYFTGLEPRRYQKLFEQVGIRVAELENCGYLRNLTTDISTELHQFNGSVFDRKSDDPLLTDLEANPRGVRFVHIQGRRGPQNTSAQELMEKERKAHKLSSFPTTSICCYDAKLVLEDAPSECFKELLKTHDHCVFQGIAMQTSRLLSLQTDTVYPKLRSA